MHAALATVAAAAALCSAIGAQPVHRESILLDDARPVAEALAVLAQRHRRVLTYDDPRYLYAEDINDVTLELRRDLDRFPPGQAPKVLVPRGGRIDFSYAVSSTTGEPGDWPALVRALLDSYVENGARFRIEHASEACHIVPAEIRNPSGLWVKTASILDAWIMIPEQELTKAGIVDAIVTAVNNERARDVLLRALHAWRPGASWRIFQQPGTDMYMLNVTFRRFEPPEPAPVTPPAIRPRDAATGCEPTPARPRCGPTPSLPFTDIENQL